MSNLIEPNAITAALVYLDRKKTRSYVGRLTRKVEKNKETFFFEYDPQYLKRKYAIPLGPDLPLSQKTYNSEGLFPSFQDRIPSKENPAYPDYCKEAGISEHEDNPIVLLSSIGKRGPSSFIFEPELKEQFSKDDIKRYRESLGLTMREFAALFEISASHLQRVESGKFPGKDIFKLIEIYDKHPLIALEEIKKNSKAIHSNKYLKILKLLQTQPSPDQLGPWADILSLEEIEYTLNLIKSLKKADWSKKFLNDTKIKAAIEAAEGYDLFIKMTDEKPNIDKLSKKEIPMVIKTKTGEIWVYGKDANGAPQLIRLEENANDIEFKDTPYTLRIPLLPYKPEIYFILNGKYHHHFHKEQVRNIKSRFFEIRFAYSIYASGLNAEYEYETGIKKKSIDFKVIGKKTDHIFMVELTSLRDSNLVKDRTLTDQYSHGSINALSETSSNLWEENSLEGLEYIKIQKIILKKAQKFPHISKCNSKTFNIIIIDVRGFLAKTSNIVDYVHIVYGGKHVDDVYRQYFKTKNTRELIKGVFESSYENPEAREKIHAIGFILEDRYTPNEIKSRTRLLINPNLVKKNEEKLFKELFTEW